MTCHRLNDAPRGALPLSVCLHVCPSVPLIVVETIEDNDFVLVGKQARILTKELAAKLCGGEEHKDDIEYLTRYDPDTLPLVSLRHTHSTHIYIY